MANKPYYGTHKTNLTLTTGKSSSSVTRSGPYKEFSSKEMVVDNQDDFVTIFELDSETVGSLDYKYSEINNILIENKSDVGVEIQYKIGGFTAGAGDTFDASKYINTIIPSGEFEYLGNPNRVVYTANTSAANGAAKTDERLMETPYLYSGVDLGASLSADGTNVQITTSSATGALVFRVGDILVMSGFASSGFTHGAVTHTTEWLEVLSIDDDDKMTVKRGLYGQGAYAHDHTDAGEKKIWFWQANLNIEPVVLVDNSVSTTARAGNVMGTMTKTGSNTWPMLGFRVGMMVFVDPADGTANMHGLITEISSDGLTCTMHKVQLLWRTATEDGVNNTYVKGYWPGTDGDGNATYTSAAIDYHSRAQSPSEVSSIVPGSIAIQFPASAHVKLGMKNLNPKTRTGLSASTDYCFDLLIDGQIENITFTTDATNMSYGGRNGLIYKIQNAINTKVRDGDLYRNCTVEMVNGDLVFKSHIAGTAFHILDTPYQDKYGISDVDIVDAGTPGSATQFLGSGNIPGKVLFSSGNLWPYETQVHPKTAEVLKVTDNFLLDDGKGRLKRAKGGSGTVNYNSAKITLAGCPPWSDFKMCYNHSSALGSSRVISLNTWENGVISIFARSVNQKADALIKVTILG